jgi:hypothetical protein
MACNHSHVAAVLYGFHEDASVPMSEPGSRCNILFATQQEDYHADSLIETRTELIMSATNIWTCIVGNSKELWLISFEEARSGRRKSSALDQSPKSR